MKKIAKWIFYSIFWLAIAAYIWVVVGKILYDRENIILFMASIGLLLAACAVGTWVIVEWKKRNKK